MPPPPLPPPPPPPCRHRRTYAHDSIRPPPEATPTRWTCTRRIGRWPGHVSNRQRAAPGPRRSFRLAKILRAPRSPRRAPGSAQPVASTAQPRPPTCGHVTSVFLFLFFYSPFPITFSPFFSVLATALCARVPVAESVVVRRVSFPDNRRQRSP